MTPGHEADKTAARRRLRSLRRARHAVWQAGQDAALASSVLDLAAGLGAAPLTVAAYVSLPGEPSTVGLRRQLRAAGHRVLLPVLLPDRDLDWVEDGAQDAGGEEVGAAVTDPLRPAGARLGRDAVRSCALVLVPALTVDSRGTRLGQGGGSYDRVLPRLARDRTLVLALLHDGELQGAEEPPLPREPHDVPVDGVVTPSAVVRLPR